VLVARLDPVLLQRRVQVHHVRHDGRTDDADGQAQLIATTEVRHHTGGELPVVLPAGDPEHVQESGADECEQAP